MVEHRLAKARAASSNLVSRFASVKITEVLFSDGFPSGQRGRTVNPLSQTSKVRILPHPLKEYRINRYSFFIPITFPQM